MPREVLLMAHSAFITAHLQRFRETGSLSFLLTALVLVVRQGRIFELVYGLYCRLFHPASTVSSSEDESALISVIKEKVGLVHRSALSRAQLIERYGATFRVELLPEDFRSARCESIWQEGNEFLVLGEYGEGGRVVLLTPNACVINDYYEHDAAVRHIHSIEGYGTSGEFLVATGDTRKSLDLWAKEGTRIRFVRRLKRNLAGYTAAIEINGEYYFGTDFSSRPNYIMTLQGVKSFFPGHAYNLYVTAFYSFFDRYLVSVNNGLRVTGGKRTLSVFDTVERRFIYCDAWAVEQHGSRAEQPLEKAPQELEA